jgi:tRNA-dihydrouridine synthase B
MIYLAPLEGYTDFIFRNAYSRHFNDIDIAVSPFISLTQGRYGISLAAQDVLPENNISMPVIPQLIGNDPDLFIQAARILEEWDYHSLNWNLGCPIKAIANKKRGSGLLPFPRLIREIFEKVIPAISQKLSVKLRLGWNDPDEIFNLIPVLNDFPLENITIHPRIGIQMYEGNINHEVFQKCIPLSKHEIIYNGDIFSLSDFSDLKNKYPGINKWMIGRGVLSNPLLPSVIKKGCCEGDKEMFHSFLLDLYQELNKYKSENFVLDRIKGYWKFFCKQFPEPMSVLARITHASSIQEITAVSECIIAGKK